MSSIITSLLMNGTALVLFMFPFNTKIHKKFSSTQSMHHSEITKIKVVAVMKQSRVLLAKPTTTAGQKLLYLFHVFGIYEITLG